MTVISADVIGILDLVLEQRLMGGDIYTSDGEFGSRVM